MNIESLTFLETIEGEGLNQIQIDITRDNEVGLSCEDGCSDSCYVVFSVDRTKELIKALNKAVNQIEKEIN